MKKTSFVYLRVRRQRSIVERAKLVVLFVGPYHAGNYNIPEPSGGPYNDISRFGSDDPTLQGGRQQAREAGGHEGHLRRVHECNAVRRL